MKDRRTIQSRQYDTAQQLRDDDALSANHQDGAPEFWFGIPTEFVYSGVRPANYNDAVRCNGACEVGLPPATEGQAMQSVTVIKNFETGIVTVRAHGDDLIYTSGTYTLATAARRARVFTVVEHSRWMVAAGW